MSKTPPIEKTLYLTTAGEISAEVKVTYTYKGVTPIPEKGRDWSEEHDHHLVSLRIELPSSPLTIRESWLVCDTPGSLNNYWSTLEITDRGPSVKEIFERLQERVSRIMEALQDHVTARYERVKKRNRALQQGKEGSPFQHVD